MIGCFNCLITGVQLQPTVWLQQYCTKWLVKNEAENSPIICGEFAMVTINSVIQMHLFYVTKIDWTFRIK